MKGKGSVSFDAQYKRLTDKNRSEFLIYIVEKSTHKQPAAPIHTIPMMTRRDSPTYTHGPGGSSVRRGITVLGLHEEKSSKLFGSKMRKK